MPLDKLTLPNGEINFKLYMGNNPLPISEFDIKNSLTVNSKAIILKNLVEGGYLLDKIEVYSNNSLVASANVTSTEYVDFKSTFLCSFDENSFTGKIDELRLVCSKDNSDFSVVLNQDINKPANSRMAVSWKISY
jgi:hypothetical protein